MKKTNITLLVLVSLLAISAKAQIVTHSLSGRVSEIYREPNGTPATSSVFSIGGPFSLSFSYDLAAEPIDSYVNPATSLSVANYNSGSLLFKYNGGAYVVSASLVNYQIINNSSDGDYFRINYVGGVVSFPPVDGYSPDLNWPGFNLQLQDTSGLFLASEALPGALSLDAFDGGFNGVNNYVALRYGERAAYNIAFRIDSIDAVAVPEPSTYGIGGALLAISLIIAKRRNKEPNLAL